MHNNQIVNYVFDTDEYLKVVEIYELQKVPNYKRSSYNKKEYIKIYSCIDSNIDFSYNNAKILKYTPKYEKYYNYSDMIKYLKKKMPTVKVDEVKITGKLFQVKYRKYKQGNMIYIYSENYSIKYISENKSDIQNYIDRIKWIILLLVAIILSVFLYISSIKI